MASTTNNNSYSYSSDEDEDRPLVIVEDDLTDKDYKPPTAKRPKRKSIYDAKIEAINQSNKHVAQHIFISNLKKYMDSTTSTTTTTTNETQPPPYPSTAAAAQPSAVQQPSTTVQQPSATQPTTTQPSAAQPTTAQPTTAQPAAAAVQSTTVQPAQPSTQTQPIDLTASTEEPAATATAAARTPKKRQYVAIAPQTTPPKTVEQDDPKSFHHQPPKDVHRPTPRHTTPAPNTLVTVNLSTALQLQNMITKQQAQFNAARMGQACDQSEEHLTNHACTRCISGFRNKLLHTSFKELRDKEDFLRVVVDHHMDDRSFGLNSAMELMMMVQQNLNAVRAVTQAPVSSKAYIYVRTLLETVEVMCIRIDKLLQDCSAPTAKSTVLDLMLYANKHYAQVLYTMTNTVKLNTLINDHTHRSWDVMALKLHYTKNMHAWLTGASCSSIVVWRDYVPSKLNLITALLSFSFKLRNSTGFQRVMDSLPHTSVLKGLNPAQIKNITLKHVLRYLPSEASVSGMLNHITSRLPEYPKAQQAEDTDVASLYHAIYTLYKRQDRRITIDEGYAIYKMFSKTPLKEFRHAVTVLLMKCFCDNIPTNDGQDEYSAMLQELIHSGLGVDALTFAPLTKEEWRYVCVNEVPYEVSKAMLVRMTWPAAINWFDWFISNREVFATSELREPAWRIVSSAIVTSRGTEIFTAPSVELWIQTYGHTGCMPLDMI
ncbi:protein ORF56 [Cyprinid herpesvirus 2]|uniref:Protein ORF56 n=1 Tax=Cyprinid herpesvirus 2 TaxID=317878 RepID=K7PCN0_CYHV2|nr:protein ORF56 [Cyprinid herpesvirus 2]AFJ20490.1 protein ORF56 [Cyprinid herpesvirus 2]